MKPMKWTTVRDKWLNDSKAFRVEYDKLKPRFEVIGELINARAREEISQTELARRMKVHANVISRLESGQHSPRVDTIVEYADALGYDLRIRAVKRKQTSASLTRPGARTPGPRSAKVVTSARKRG